MTIVGRLVGVLVLAGISLAWADPVEELKACQTQQAAFMQQAAELGALRAKVHDAQTMRTAYIAKLAEMLAETRDQLDQARAQVRALGQELQRMKPAPVPPPAAK